jgi:hypothetical protein
VTYDAVGPPPSPPRYRHVTGPRDDVAGHVIARTEFSLLRVPPPPDLPVYGGGRGLRGPRRMLRPGRHLYEGGLGTRGPSPLTHTNLIPRY